MMMVTGSVSIHASKMFLMVSGLRFFIPFEATMLPAIPDDNTCVVLTGSLKNVANPMVLAATNSAEAP